MLSFFFSYLASNKTSSPAPYCQPHRVGGLLGLLFPNLNKGK